MFDWITQFSNNPEPYRLTMIIQAGVLLILLGLLTGVYRFFARRASMAGSHLPDAADKAMTAFLVVTVVLDIFGAIATIVVLLLASVG